MKGIKYLILAMTATLFLSCGKTVEKRAVVLLLDSDIENLKTASDSLVANNIPFVFGRTIRPEDTSEMMALLTEFTRRKSELCDSVAVPDGVCLIKVNPAEADEAIARIKSEGWTVKTTSAWKRIIRDEQRKDTFRTYYVAENGDDANDGLSPETAWKTLAKVNDAELGYGDSVLFRSGDIFRGHLRPLCGREGAPIVYSRFGSGEKPVIEPSFDASTEADWEKAGDRLWRCVKISEFELGNVILNHGEFPCAIKQDRLEQILGRDLNFTWVRDEKAVYMVSDINPALRFTSIELAEKVHVIEETECHDDCYDGLWLRYGSAHGIGGHNTKRITVRNCDVCWIGGSTHYIDNTGTGVRFGNAIEFWANAEDILVENCRIWEVWDAGLTNQSNVPGTVQRNITYRGNEIRNCEYSYEYWQQGEGAVTENIVLENNKCIDAGYGWGHERRWNPNAAHLMFYDNTAETKGFIIRGNEFGKSKNCVIRLFNGWYPEMTVENNSWDFSGDILCRYHGRPVSGLIHKNPDHLDEMRDDNEAVIQSQTFEEPMVFGSGEEEFKRFETKFGFRD